MSYFSGIKQTDTMCKSKQIRDFDSLFDLVSYFDTEEKCVDHLIKWRWNGEPACPYCASSRVNELKGKTKRFKCYGCRKQFSARVGTIFHDSKLSLRKWFIAIFIFTAHKRGISSHQLSRDLSITQKTAWFVLHRIREMLREKSPQMLGESKMVETDATYIGGKEGNKHINKRRSQKDKNLTNEGKTFKPKKTVIGIIERDGKVALRYVSGETTENMVESRLDSKKRRYRSMVKNKEEKTFKFMIRQELEENRLYCKRLIDSRKREMKK